MRSRNARPQWWLLYLTFPLLIALFALEHRLKISTRGHEAAQLGILLLVYGLIYWWLKANGRAISRLDQQSYGKVRVIQIPPLHIDEADDETHPMLQILTSEVKGVLSDTFEMDQVSQQVNKE